MPQIKYAGNHSADYNHQAGTGLVGKVVGGRGAPWYLITSASYDEASDTTFATAVQIGSPAQRLAEQVSMQ